MAAFVFARMQFRGREALFTLFVFGLLFPTAVAILPLFILVRQPRPHSATRSGVALPQAAFALPLTIVILRPFFRSIPAELEDAARIDGCSSFGFFWRVLLPLARPALATVSVLAVVGSGTPSSCRWSCSTARTSGRCRWAPRTSRPSTRPTRPGSSPSRSCRMIPAFVFYAIAERQLVGGLTSGAVKG